MKQKRSNDVSFYTWYQPHIGRNYHGIYLLAENPALRTIPGLINTPLSFVEWLNGRKKRWFWKDAMISQISI